MSSNRSVQAAQRRRAGPADPPAQTRYPQPSINSAQAFANQPRPTTLNKYPSSSSSSSSNFSQSTADITAGVTKMTIHQAITLITLRLGSVESKLMQIEYEGQDSSQESYVDENKIVIDKSVIELLTSRIESLEKRSTTNNATNNNSNSVAGTEVAVLKQQLDAIKPILIQTKNTSAAVVKENKDLKLQVDVLRQELNETKELLQLLQNVTSENSQKIVSLSLSIDTTLFLTDEANVLDTEEVDDDDDNDDNRDNEKVDITDIADIADAISFTGANIKELIENEINLNAINVELNTSSNE